MRPQINPDQIKPYQHNCSAPLALVRKYRKPETWGSLVLPATHLEDRSWTLFEIVRASADFEREVGMKLAEGDIIKTKGNLPPTDTGFASAESGRELFLVAASEVRGVFLAGLDVSDEDR